MYNLEYDKNNPTGWMTKAECGFDDQDLFFPADRESTRNKIAREKAVKKICESCVVMNKCLSYAIVNSEVGVWGGTNDEERKQIAKKALGRHRRVI